MGQEQQQGEQAALETVSDQDATAGRPSCWPSWRMGLIMDSLGRRFGQRNFLIDWPVMDAFER